MKKLSRMTALLLALMMLVTSVPITALAEITLPTSTWQNWVSNVKDAFQQAQTTTEAFSTTVDVPVTAQRVAEEYQTQAEYTTADTNITLPKGTTARLTSVDGAGQWQIVIDEEHAADIPGETGDSIILNERLLANGAVTLRCGSGTPVTVKLSAGTVLADSAETIAVQVSGERQVRTGKTFTAGDLGINTLDTTPDVKKTYNIVINYLFENNEIVSDPYTASLAEGSSFSATVTFPTVQGYLPYVNNVQKNSMELNYTNITENVTINVVYKPTNVNYTVIHYQQNVDNDQYTIESTETKQGLTGSQVPEVAKTFEGFYSLLYERPAIAADGSTVIEVYYDRYYYLMNFDMDGGYGTEPVYARYGANIGTVTEPTKAGYTFVGWSEQPKPDGEDTRTAVTLPTTMPAESKTYYAIWQVTDAAKVTVVFWGENADDEEYSYLANYTKEIYLKPGTTIQYDGKNLLTCGVHSHDANCYKLTCTQVPHKHNNCTLACTHTHTISCYKSNNGLTTTTKPSQTLIDQGNGIYTYEEQGFVSKTIHYFVKIGDQWYCGKNRRGNADNTIEITYNCQHAHDDSCYTCGKKENNHSHTDYTGSCYQFDCDKTTHTHSNSCYATLKGITDTTRWYFVKSDTTTVAADGSTVLNVYYDRVEYSVQFYSRGNNPSEYTDLKITAKWGADISDKWPTKNGSSNWYVNAQSQGYGASDPMQARLLIMPVGGDKFYGPQTGSGSATASYYVEKVESTDSSKTSNYKLHHTDTIPSSNATVTTDDMYAIDGFTFNSSLSTSTGAYFSGATFYYTRNSYNLTFNDQYDDVKNETVKFEAPLSTYKDYVPEVPSAYEPGSVEFGGWYQNPQCTGEEYKLDEHTMPSHDIILYAKWVPVTHTVTFYLDKSAYEADTKLDTHPAVTVLHGSLVEPTPEDPIKGAYTFIGWFYMEGDEEKAFDFANMQVRKDLEVYGKWSSKVMVRYMVRYVLKDTETKVAKDEVLSGLGGLTKTHDAAGEEKLFENYKEGYFPTVQSQSVTLSIEPPSEPTDGWVFYKTEEESEGVYIQCITFEYEEKPAVPYTVKYVEKDTGKSLADDKVVSDNRKAVVTETFKPISGYMPDAYQKRLVVTADGENILYFYYSKDETHAYYKITHFTQNTDGATWTEYASSQAVGDIGTRYTASPMTIPGFTYKEIKYVVNSTEITDVTAEGAKLTADGLEINLYYVRNEYPYQVRYLEQGSVNVLHDPKNGTGKYGQVISESAIDIDGYDKVDPTSATLNIRIDEGEGAPNLNIITFYYKEQKVTIDYVAVGPEKAENFGSVNPTTETVKVKSGEVQGSTPTAGDGFKFVGWFKDAACTEAVDASWVTDNKIVPAKDENGKNVAATYYAKFEYDITDLTITKTGVQDIDANASFIFNVKGGDTDLNVVIKGNDSVTIKNLKVGTTYTVTEIAGNWRYNPTNKTQTITLKPDAKENAVTFQNSRDKDKWLDSDAYSENVFNGVTE